MTAQQARNLSATANADLVGNVFPLIEAAANQGRYTCELAPSNSDNDDRIEWALRDLGFTVGIANSGQILVAWA